MEEREGRKGLPFNDNWFARGTEAEEVGNERKEETEEEKSNNQNCIKR